MIYKAPFHLFLVNWCHQTYRFLYLRNFELVMLSNWIALELVILMGEVSGLLKLAGWSVSGVDELLSRYWSSINLLNRSTLWVTSYLTWHFQVINCACTLDVQRWSRLKWAVWLAEILRLNWFFLVEFELKFRLSGLRIGGAACKRVHLHAELVN